MGGGGRCSEFENEGEAGKRKRKRKSLSLFSLFLPLPLNNNNSSLPSLAQAPRLALGLEQGQDVALADGALDVAHDQAVLVVKELDADLGDLGKRKRKRKRKRRRKSKGRKSE